MFLQQCAHCSVAYGCPELHISSGSQGQSLLLTLLVGTDCTGLRPHTCVNIREQVYVHTYTYTYTYVQPVYCSHTSLLDEF